ncbi:blast:Gamma-glutamylcyclotransferase [Drosophila guanche]|uniref:gamma-glutamylcyclotransferase n=1 Tax=Drosophila guanche TaxID=7266 RepID=A0A3B0K9J1_DROGU|nr:blast:Gamma-glutamylcyclotransferase [Drosophila guanche]
MNIKRLTKPVVLLLSSVRISNGCKVGPTSSIRRNISGNDSMEALPEVHGNKFFYFGFGSNMLAQRIHIQNPTAQRIGAVLLSDYRLDFAHESPRWRGASATIVHKPGEHTWGALWEIDLSNMADIDKYILKAVKLQNEETHIAARAFMMTKTHLPETILYDMSPDQVPPERQPSKTYLRA